jgi:hypothetical protein
MGAILWAYNFLCMDNSDCKIFEKEKLSDSHTDI